MIKPITKKKIYETVSEQIEQLIISGEWKEGMRIPTEDDLASVFNVGRGSIREAITSLQMSGILVSSPGLGTYVADNAIVCINNSHLAEMLNDQENLNELIEARYILEPELAALAAIHATPKDIKNLQNLVDRMSKGKDKEEMATYGHLFHIAISEICGNVILVNLYKSITEPIRKMRRAGFLTYELYQNDIPVHQSILDAIAAGDPTLAEERMREHLKKDYYDNRNLKPLFNTSSKKS